MRFPGPLLWGGICRSHWADRPDGGGQRQEARPRAGMGGMWASVVGPCHDAVSSTLRPGSPPLGPLLRHRHHDPVPSCSLQLGPPATNTPDSGPSPQNHNPRPSCFPGWPRGLRPDSRPHPTFPASILFMLHAKAWGRAALCSPLALPRKAQEASGSPQPPPWGPVG